MRPWKSLGTLECLGVSHCRRWNFTRIAPPGPTRTSRDFPYHDSHRESQGRRRLDRPVTEHIHIKLLILSPKSSYISSHFDRTSDASAPLYVTGSDGSVGSEVSGQPLICVR